MQTETRAFMNIDGTPGFSVKTIGTFKFIPPYSMLAKDAVDRLVKLISSQCKRKNKPVIDIPTEFIVDKDYNLSFVLESIDLFEFYGLYAKLAHEVITVIHQLMELQLMDKQIASLTREKKQLIKQLIQ